MRANNVLKNSPMLSIIYKIFSYQISMEIQFENIVDIATQWYSS